MPPQVIIVFVLAIGLPIAWFVSEYQQRRWLRIVLGILSLTMSVFLAFAFNVMQRFQYNSDYGFASAKLMDTTIAELEANRTEKLLPALRDLRSRFYPTYENRAYYDQLVDEFVAQFNTTPPRVNEVD